MSGAIYSDAWYKIANAHVGLLPGVKATHQSYRGQAWVVLEDAYAHRYFRITPDAHDFLKTLNASITVDEAWQSYLREQPERAPGQEEVVQLLLILVEEEEVVEILRKIVGQRMGLITIQEWRQD